MFKKKIETPTEPNYRQALNQVGVCFKNTDPKSWGSVFISFFVNMARWTANGPLLFFLTIMSFKN